LSKKLYSMHNEVCSDVASGIEELHDVGVFAVDVHGGNVGRDPENLSFKIFDVGTASSPTVRVKDLPGKRAKATPAASEAYSEAACENVAVSVIVIPSPAPAPTRLVAAKGKSPKAQHTHPVVPAAEEGDPSAMGGAEEKVTIAYEASEDGFPWFKPE